MARLRIHIEADELRRLEVDISQAPGRLQRNAGPTSRKVGNIVNKEMKVDAAGHGNVPHLPKSVTDELLDPWTVEVGLGPRPGTQGSLAHIIVYGSVNNAPVYDHITGPRRALPRVERLWADAAGDAVLGDD